MQEAKVALLLLLGTLSLLQSQQVECQGLHFFQPLPDSEMSSVSQRIQWLEFEMEQHTEILMRLQCSMLLSAINSLQAKKMRLSTGVYFYQITSMTWKNSRELCRTLSSDLANFDTPEEINVVAEGMRVQGLRSNWFWVGASNAHAGDFHWTNGPSVNASLWSTQQSPESLSNPDQCGCLFTKQETMFSFACSERAYVLCELPAGLADGCFV